MRIGAIIQAREGSSRLPGKATIDICGKPALRRVVERVQQSKVLDIIIVATTTNAKDDVIEEMCKDLGCRCFRGSEENVLDRVLNAAKEFQVDVIVEITADCLLIDWNHINHLAEMHINSDFDMTSNILSRTFPRGYDIRIFNTKALERVNNEVDNDIDRQHVSTWMYLNPKGKENYKCQNWAAPVEQFRPDIEVTLDTPEDLELIRWLFEYTSNGYNMELICQDVINLINHYPDKYKKVKEIKRKNYFEEIKEEYAKQENNNKGSEKQDEQSKTKSKRRGRPKKKV
ncbi:MAG: cytidylyltransferase domain-containing protein [Candidatus Odinarchaeota archaeon]